MNVYTYNFELKKLRLQEKNGIEKKLQYPFLLWNIGLNMRLQNYLNALKYNLFRNDKYLEVM